MGTPRFKSFSAFSEEIVALIDSCNTRDRACLVVQNFVGNMGGDPKPCHSRNTGSSQIMKAPPGDAGKLVDLSLCRAEALKGTIPRPGEDKFMSLVGSVQNF